MHYLHILPALSFASALSPTPPTSTVSPLPSTFPTSNTTYLIAPALVTKKNATTIQCWKLISPFKRSSVPGVSGTQVVTIGNFTNLGYTILPPRYDGGTHNAPVPQLVHFLSGVAHVTLPHDPATDLWIVGGKGGLLFAVDTMGSGHITRYPSDEETISITAPFEGGKLPEYEVLSKGPCLGKQTSV